MGSVLLSASSHSTWSRGAQKHRVTVPRCSPALLRDVLQHLTPTCKAGEQRVETRTESPGRKKGYKHVKTRRQTESWVCFFHGLHKELQQVLSQSLRTEDNPTLPGMQLSHLSWPSSLSASPPSLVRMKGSCKYPKASWGANGVLVAWGVGKTLSAKGEDRHAYDWAVSLL